MGVNNAEVISNRINTSLTYGWDNPGRAEDLKEKLKNPAPLRMLDLPNGSSPFHPTSFKSAKSNMKSPQIEVFM